MHLQACGWFSWSQAPLLLLRALREQNAKQERLTSTPTSEGGARARLQKDNQKGILHMSGAESAAGPGLGFRVWGLGFRV